MTTERLIEVLLQGGPDESWRVVASCEDEETIYVTVGKTISKPTEEMLEGDFGAAVVLDHQTRCTSCQQWMAPRPVPPAKGEVPVPFTGWSTADGKPPRQGW